MHERSFASWDATGRLARFAPTPHNTQPFRIQPRDDASADIIAIGDRFLPREDHGNLYVASAFGIFASAIETAAASLGYAAQVSPLPDVDVAALHARPRTLLGHAELTSAGRPPSDAALLESRRTSRLPYHDRPVPADAIAGLTRIAEEHGHRFVSYDSPEMVTGLLELNANAIIDNLAFDDEREEIRRWYRYGRTPEHGDGLWQVPLNQPAWELRSAFAAPRLFGLPGFRWFAVHRYLRTQAGTRTVGFLDGPFERWPDLVRAGRMLMRFWLEMTAHDLYMQPMGSMLTNPEYAREIARRYSLGACWLAFRIGYSDPPPRAPRLESIVLYE